MQNPQVNIYEDKDSLIGTDGIDPTIESFQMAFALDNASTLEIKNDARFVKWYAVQWIGEGGNIKRRAIPMHQCTEKDYKKFYPPSKTSIDVIQRLKDENGLYCVDWESAGV